ncbi:hypothetical protein [Paracoccus sp. ME4]|uniref:hypothetical protein n=1 Tax=Paracoccus sp. ME4 TaxID=3138066 RepID=UPI00398ACFD7
MTDGRAAAEEDLVVAIVPVKALVGFGSALHDDPWGVGLTEEMVRICLASGDVLGPEPIACRIADPMRHAARIAWLCREGWADPIVFSAGLPGMGIPPAGWRFLDGNHRLAAAEFMGMDVVPVLIDGDIDAGLEELLGACGTDAPSPG